MGIVAIGHKRIKEVGAGFYSGIVAFSVSAPARLCMVLKDERSFAQTVSVRAGKAFVEGDGCDGILAQTDG